MDRDLLGDELKLVRYKILFVKRDLEVAFPEREELVADSLTGESFAGWKVAEFLHSLGKGETGVPGKWAARDYPPAGYAEGGRLKGLPEADKKYLRVYFEVLDRYVREEAEEDETNVLRQIRDGINRL